MAVGLLALAVGAGALWLSEENGMGVTAQESVQEAPADAEPDHDTMPGMRSDSQPAD